MNRQRVHQLNGESLDAPELPKLAAGWCWTTLETIAEINGGITKDQKRKATATTREVPYLRVANVQRGFLDLTEIKTILADADELDALRLRTGDVLFTEGGDRDKLGRGWIWNDEIPDCIHQNHIFRARLLTDDISPKFVSLHGNTFGQEWFSKTGKQTTNLASINKGVLRRFPVPIAPANEQRRIVAKIEELFSDLDAGVAALERARANLKRYRAGVLKSAVEGKLTADWRAQHPPTEPASALLQRILKERRAKWEADQLAKFAAAGKTPPKDWQKKYVEPTPPDTTGLPELPEGWCWATIDLLARPEPNSIKAGPFGSSLKKEFYVPAGYKIYGQEQVLRGDPYFGDYFIDDEKYRSLESCRVRPRDLLISLVGTIGRTLVLPLDAVPGIINPRLLKITCDEDVALPEFVSSCLQSPGAKQIFGLLSHGGTMEILNLTTLRGLAFPLPPRAEQSVILEEFGERLSQIDAAETAINHGLQRAARLRQSILKQAFEGKLVPQAPTDDPASVLLERIAGAKTAETPKPRRGRAKAAAKGETR